MSDNFFNKKKVRRGDITAAAMDVLGAYAPDKLLASFQQFLTTPKLRNRSTMAHILVLSTLVKALQGDAKARDTMFKVGVPNYQTTPTVEMTRPEEEENKMLPLYDAIERSAVQCWGAAEEVDVSPVAEDNKDIDIDIDTDIDKASIDTLDN